MFTFKYNVYENTIHDRLIFPLYRNENNALLYKYTNMKVVTA